MKRLPVPALAALFYVVSSRGFIKHMGSPLKNTDRTK